MGWHHSPFLQALSPSTEMGDGCSSPPPLLLTAGLAEVRMDWPQADCS